MCLIAKTEIRTANRSITCYKRLLRYPNGTLKSPYYGEVYEVGETKEVKFFTDENDRKIVRRTNPTAINQGLHAFTTLEKARRIQLYTVIRCVIPKGTKYVLGDEGDIVALKLKVKEVVYE
jgi:hypothetical protein